MTFEVELDGRARAVSIERAGSARYRVTVDGRPLVVDAVRVGEFGLSLLVDGDGEAAGIGREILVTPAGIRGELLATLDGRTVPVAVDGRRRRRGPGDAGAHASGDQPIVAPMPGRVVRLLVAPGDEVAARQGVVVVEAMKMENELRSPRAGRVKEISVAPGTSVEAGRVLVVVE